MKTTFNALGLSVLLAATAGAQTVKTLVSNGSLSQLYDMVIIGDGYRSVEQGQFDIDCQKVISRFRDNAITFPYNDYFRCYNVHSVFRASAESGADQPDKNPQIWVNTAYDASFNYGNTPRCLYLATSAGRARAASDAALAPATDGRVLVLVNTSRYGGCASTFAVSYNGSQMEAVNAHEWGHSFGGLADEYDYGRTGTYSGNEPTAPNITKSSVGSKWSHFNGFAGPNSTVGAYLGAGYYQSGLYRPESNCKMRANNVLFCTICREHLIKRFHQLTTMVYATSPSSTTSARRYSIKNFTIFDRIPASTVKYEWRVDNGPWLVGGNRLNWAVGNSLLGNHLIRCRITDTTSWVRNDPGNDLVYLKSWTCNVLNDVAAQTDFKEVLPASTTNTGGGSNSSFPWNSSGSQRVMYVYDREVIDPTTPVKITGIQYRPGNRATRFAGATYQFALDVSTSRRAANNLNYTFDNNHGSDRVTVFNGALTVPSYNLRGSTPSPFTLTVPFTTPFEWDPRCGPLLLDFKHRGIIIGSGSTMDGLSDSSGHQGRIAHTSNADATVATFPGSGNTQGYAMCINLLLDCDVAPYTAATAEGGSATAYPWSRSGAMRIQQVYDQNVHQLRGNNKITRLAWRTDNGKSYSGNRVYTMKVTMSTGVPGLSTSMSSNFAANHGPDKKVVFDGSVRLGATSINTGPSPFNQVLELQSPFDYSENAGSLVIDIQLYSASSSTTVTWDGLYNTGVGIGRVWSLLSANATTGGTPQDFALAMCISAVKNPIMPHTDDGSPGTSASSFPWNTATPQRAMYVYARQQLDTYEPINITHLSWRPDQNSGALGPLVYGMTIDLSTGVNLPNALSRVFNENHGADRVRAFAGNISVPYRRSSGSPADWAISVKLDRPFRWTPLSGPLVVDIRDYSGKAAGQAFDGSTASGSGGAYRIVHRSNASAATADFGPQSFALSIKLGGVGCNGQAEPYGRGCSGTNGVPVASSIGLPWTGNKDFEFAMFNGGSNQNATILYGLSSQNLNLGFLGLPACNLLSTGEFGTTSKLTNANGDASVAAPTPVNSSLNGVSFYTQWICIDPGAPGGITVSNGAKFTICH